MKTIEFRGLKKSLMIFGFSLMTTVSFAQQTTTSNSSATPTAIGTTKTWGSIDGVQMIGMVQGPSAANAELQVACVFEYTEGDIFVSPPALPAALNGLVHLDEALKGKLTEIRKTGEFKGHALETLLLTPPTKTLGARKLLLIGLGDRNKFTPELMISVGEIATREALKLGVSNFAFASDLKDAGIDSPTALVAGNVVRGVVNEYRTQNILKSQKLTTFKPLNKVFLLAGPSFFTVAGGGIAEAIAQYKN
ncbi:M17 family peptidase N-terminal domain-containing protein [Elizabethkingia miricola]|uniref:M17 family peptidase N-terminal domain-containing protein n=1 Tax=Elizabethkingia miricola TaxID=172045 RepID=A0ABD5B7P1_ELIMR|nr:MULTISPECIES: M17 family peptidase N-terminal domain-containing protein [Elizabethkingia]MDQ8749846.1 M17 family peptidase N-terminal domain-containing protein [Elizabethkingia miricola]NHQ67884.1 peptidase M17 [Elizabethkingia miricola]NHQ71529.1 peptidase M17 [Elizabethkingia miricola]NHQ78372.1 peptidase M17 [Elizabethkingia miricola]OPB90132.1 peptidase M17 [Elizabethkingia miricola]